MAKKILLILTSILLSDCGKADCNKSVDYYRKMDMNFVILDKKALNHGREVNFKIKNNLNNRDEMYCEENTWFAWHYADFEVRDTVIKIKGETIFSIHKKGKILSFPYECDGKTYK